MQIWWMIESMEERERIENAIKQLVDQRETLGEETFEVALEGLHRRLSELDETKTDDKEKTEHTGERRVVTVLFCDVAGSTALAESMDPEAWTDIMEAAFEHLIEPVERYGGTVARLMGDAILAFFGAPTAHEDDPQRAILAGLSIVENILPYREKLRQEKGVDFNVRVGINTGLAVVGDIGSETAGEYTAMGDAVNLAARMEQTAAPGTVQIAEDTHAMVAPLFDFEELGGIQVKGKSEPVLAYQVLGAKADHGSLRGLTDQGISSPLVGRESEFESARNAVDRLAAGQGGILVIKGEAGIGKSRLVVELQRSLTINNSPLNWLEGHTLSYGQTMSYWPFQEILRSYAGITEEDNEAAAWSKLESSIKGLFQEETADILPYLASVLSIDVGEDYLEKVKYLDGEALGRQVYRASRRFFQRLAEGQPLVLLFEDLHWIDASSAGLLEHLLSLVERIPLLLCCLSRPDVDSSASRLLEIVKNQYGSQLTLVELLPLTPNESRHLVQNLLAIDGLPEPTRQLILDKADGNPFFLEEIVRDLIESGALERDSSTGRWQATHQIEKVTVPDTIQGLLIARVDRLEEDLKRVVRRAAVIGRAFLYRILNLVMGHDHDLDLELEKLQNAELIREKQRLPELEYIFKHALAQEAAYDGILIQERREIHTRVGAAIEKLMADRLDEFYGLLAYHYSAAEQWEKAQEYLYKAGDQAGSVAADAEALAHYRQAMEVFDRVRGDDWDQFEKAQLERKIGEALYRLGDFNQARAYLERSLALLGENLPTSKWGIRLGIAAALVIQIGHRLFPGRFNQPENSTTNPKAKEIFLAALALIWIEIVSNFERTSLIALRALNATEKGGYPYGSAYLAAFISTSFDFISQYGLADRYYRLASNYSIQVVPYHPVFQIAWSRAYHYNLLGDFDESLKYALQGIEIAQSTGDTRNWGTAMDVAAWAHLVHGDLEEVAEIRLEMIAVAEDSSDSQVLCWGYFGLGVLQFELGQIDESIRNLQRAIEVAEEVPDFHTQLGAGAWLGRSLLAKGMLNQALTLLEDRQELYSVHGIWMDAPYLGNAKSEAYLAAAERSTGKSRQEWLKKAGLSCRETLKAAMNNRAPLPDALLFKGRYEWLRGKPGAARKWWHKAMDESRRIKDPYKEGMVHLEIGHRLGDPGDLQQAESILEEVGAEFDLGKAREALANLWKGG